VALKLECRLKPVLTQAESGVEYVSNIEGGLFLELAAQNGMIGKNAAFGWQDRETLLTAKLGIRDVTQLLAAKQAFELTGATPFDIQPQPRGDRALAPEIQRSSVSLFHKFGDQTTAISVQFTDDAGLIIGISKGKDRRRSIKLDRYELLGFFRYLELALDQFLSMGHR
jgi:hypothetical protein